MLLLGGSVANLIQKNSVFCKVIKSLAVVFAGTFLAVSVESSQISKEQIRGLDEQVQDIKSDVLEISTDLNQLEEKLLYPSGTQVAFFISLVADEDFQLDAVEIELNGKPVAHHIYSFKEQNALINGGVQRVYTGNARTGDHQIKVGFRGKTELGSEFNKVADYTLSKSVGPDFIEIRLVSSSIGSGDVEFIER